MCFGVTPLTTGVSHVLANFGVAGRTGLQPVIKVRLASSGMGTPRPGPALAPSALGCRGVLAGTSGRALNEAFNQDRCQTHRGGRRRLHFPSRLPASPCHLLGGKSPFLGGGGRHRLIFQPDGSSRVLGRSRSQPGLHPRCVSGWVQLGPTAGVWGGGQKPPLGARREAGGALRGCGETPKDVLGGVGHPALPGGFPDTLHGQGGPGAGG